MLDICIWILVNFGIANGIAVSKLTSPFRDWMYNKLGTTLFYCVMCLGFWSGMLLSLVWRSPTGFFLWDAFFGSATAWILYLLISERQNKY